MDRQLPLDRGCRPGALSVLAPCGPRAAGNWSPWPRAKQLKPSPAKRQSLVSPLIVSQREADLRLILEGSGGLESMGCCTHLASEHLLFIGFSVILAELVYS